MQIREIHIDGFGIFSNKQVTCLTSGLNVIYGENEAGKTTLTEFIRRMLFEVSKRGKGFNSYPPLYGGRHGGKLKCQSASGDTLLISRNLSGRDDITLSTPNEERRGQSALDTVLDHASTTIFQNIFAFTLDELQNFDSLKEDEIRNRIYGAELGLGTVSLKQVEDSVNKRADAIFSPRGKKTQSNILLQDIKTLEQNIRNIQNEAEEYDQLMRHLELCESQQTARQIQIDSLESLIRNLESLAGLYNTIDEEEAGLNKLKIEKDALSVNNDLLAHEAEVIFLQQSTQSIHSTLNDKVTVQRETTLLENKIQSDLQEIGVFWNEDKVKSFEFNRSKSDQIKSYLKAFEDLRQGVIRAEDQLANHQERKAEEQSKGSNIPLWLKFIAGCLSTLGLVGMAWSLVELNIPVLTASIISLLFGVFIFWKSMEGRKDFIRVDLLEKKLEEKLDQAQLSYNRKNLEWRTWLKEIEFDEKLEPLTAQEMANTLKEIQGNIFHKEELKARMQEMFKFEENINRRINKLKPSVPDQSLSDHIPSNIKIICELFDQSKINQQSKDQIEKQIQQQNFKLEKLKNQLQETNRSLEQIIEKAEAPDGEDGPSKNRIFENQNSLQEEINLASTQLKKLDTEKNLSHQTIGETRNKLRQLASNEELSIQQETLEIKKQNLKECAREWGQAKIALFMLDAAKSQYEKTRQPGVLKAAETIFSGITEEKYPRIVKPIGEDEILIESKIGDRKKITEMSRGTREQLYLSMRLGLIEEYESRSEPLPIIMDDVLVNFDDPRKIRVIEMLKHFAETRQIIVLTCHKASLQDYIKSGATQIEI
jgi:uncharacterized protein YhaN